MAKQKRVRIPKHLRDRIDELELWDDRGESIDRYTVVWPDGSYLAMSGAPFWPQGFCQHGEGAMREPEVEPVRRGLRSYLGFQIDFFDLPPDCKRAVLQDLQHDYEWEREHPDADEMCRYPSLAETTVCMSPCYDDDCAGCDYLPDEGGEDETT